MTKYSRFHDGAGQTRYSQSRKKAAASPYARQHAPQPVEAGEHDAAEDLAAPEGARQAAPQAEAVKTSLVLKLFLIALVVPVLFDIGPAYFNPHRLILFVMFLPMFGKWISQTNGRVYGNDLLFLAFTIWMGISVLVVHGFGRIELFTMNIIEGFGAFLVGRIYVRNKENHEWLLKYVFYAALILTPAALIEGLTGIRVYSKIADAIGQTYSWVYNSGFYQKRMGLYRAQTVFEHPILFGVFVSTGFGLLYHMPRKNGQGIAGYRRAWVSGVATFLSLSTGALLALTTQIGLTLWDKIMRGIVNHWKVLIGLVVLGYVVVDALSNRTPMQVFISYATFNAQTGYMRVNIFVFGIQNVWAHPIFGLGMRDWVRPSWMPPSVDNFWLLMAMRHGIPGFLLVAAAFFGTIIRTAGARISDTTIGYMRKGYIVSLVGLVLSLTTVHIWGPAYAFVCFLLGAGTWMRDWAAEHPAQEDATGGAQIAARASTRSAGPPATVSRR